MADYQEIPRGQLSSVILASLKDKDKYGYEIIDEVLANTNGKVSIKQPSLYSSLKRMEEQSLISSYWRESEIGGRRHYYHLTDLGKKYLEKWDSQQPKQQPTQQTGPDYRILQQENMFRGDSTQVSSTEQQKEDGFIQFNLFASSNMITPPENKEPENTMKINQQQIINQNPILTHYETNDTPKYKFSANIKNKCNQSFIENVFNTNTYEEKKYDVSTNEKSDNNNDEKKEVSASPLLKSQNQFEETPNDRTVKEDEKQHIKKISINELEGYIPRQTESHANERGDDSEQSEENKPDDGILITERIEIGNVPKSTPWDKRYDFYVSGNSISNNFGDEKTVRIEDRVKSLYEQSKNSADNQKIETIDSKCNFQTYGELEAFYKEQKIKFKPYQKTLKKSENDFDMIRITKINMLVSLMVLVVYSVISFIFALSLNDKDVYLNGAITYFAYPIVLLAIFFGTFIAFKHSPQKRIAKKNQFKLNFNLTVLSIIFIPVIFAINLLCGLTFDNLLKYVITLFYFSTIALTYFVYFISLKILSKSKRMY